MPQWCKIHSTFAPPDHPHFCAAISEHTLVNEPCHEKTTLVTWEQNQTSHHIPIITSDHVLHHLEWYWTKMSDKQCRSWSVATAGLHNPTVSIFVCNLWDMNSALFAHVKCRKCNSWVCQMVSLRRWTGWSELMHIVQAIGLVLKSQADDKADDNSCDWRFKG